MYFNTHTQGESKKDFKETNSNVYPKGPKIKIYLFF